MPKKEHDIKKEKEIAQLKHKVKEQKKSLKSTENVM